MEMKSVTGVSCYVKDLNKTCDFYKMLGFEFRKKTDEHATAYLNWFWIDFVAINKEEKSKFQKEANIEPKGGGMFLYIDVENVDDFHKGVVAKGLQPSSEPQDWPWGNREFVLRDPDGYKLVFFKRN